MRAFTACLLVFIFAFNMVGSVLSFRISREAVRRQSRMLTEQTHVSSLTRFVFTPAEFNAVHQGDKEMVINGEHYDIKHLSHQNGSVIVDARHDHHETELVREFVAWMKEKITDTEPIHKRTHVKFTQLEFYCLKAFLNTPATFTVSFYHTADWPVFCRALTCYTPPPDCTIA